MSCCADKIALMKRVRAENPELYRRTMNAAIAKTQSKYRGGGLGATANYGGLTAAQVVALQDAEFANMANSPAPTGALTETVKAWSDIFKDWGTAALSLEQMKACTDINRDRLSRGLPAIDCSTAGLGAGVTVGMSADTKTAVYVAIGAALIGAWLFSRKG